MVDGERLLLVEDDAATREVLTLLLEGEGWRVTAVESGEAALASVAEVVPVPLMVLCDLRLPGICGEALASALREALGEDAVVMAMTATASAAATGYDGVAIKPFPPQAIEAGWRLKVLRETPDVRDLAQLRFGTEGIGGSVGLNVSMSALVQDDVGTRAEPAEPILKLSTMDTLRRSMGEDGMRGLYAFALADAGDRLEQMDAAVASRDGGEFSRQAHALKGSAGMLGARELWRLAGDAESVGLDGNGSNKVLRLRGAVESVRLMLETLFPL